MKWVAFFQLFQNKKTPAELKAQIELFDLQKNMLEAQLNGDRCLVVEKPFDQSLAQEFEQNGCIVPAPNVCVLPEAETYNLSELVEKMPKTQETELMLSILRNKGRSFEWFGPLSSEMHETLTSQGVQVEGMHKIIDEDTTQQIGYSINLRK